MSDIEQETSAKMKKAIARKKSYTGGSRRSSRLNAKKKLDKFSNDANDPENIPDGDDQQTLNATQHSRGGGTEKNKMKSKGGVTKQAISRKRGKQDDGDETEKQNASSSNEGHQNNIEDSEDSGNREHRTKAANDPLQKKISTNNEPKKKKVKEADTELERGKGEKKDRKGKGIAKMDEDTDNNDKPYYYTLTTRMSLKPLCKSMEKLNTKQKACLKELGFGALLKMTLDSIPTRLAYYVVDNYEPTEYAIYTKSGHIQITHDTIHDMIGVPTGGVRLDSLDQNDYGRSIKDDWVKQFETEEIRTAHVIEKIHESQEADLTFKLNFMVVFANTMARVKSQGFCDYDFIKRLNNAVELKDIDWCDYIYESLMSRKLSWKGKGVLSYFCGPLTTLALHYVDSMKCDGCNMSRTRPAINGWTFMLMKKREDLEVSIGGFGLGDWYQPYQNIGDNAARKEELLEQLEEMYLSLMDIKEKSDAIMSTAMAMHPNDPDFKAWDVKVKKLFLPEMDVGPSNTEAGNQNEKEAGEGGDGK